jgi:hypothetical protein
LGGRGGCLRKSAQTLPPRRKSGAMSPKTQGTLRMLLRMGLPVFKVGGGGGGGTCRRLTMMARGFELIALML